MGDPPLWFFFPDMEIIGSEERWVISMSERVVVTHGFGRAETRFGKIKCINEHGYMVPLRYQEEDLAKLRKLRKRIRRHIDQRTDELNRAIEHELTDGRYDDIPVDLDIDKGERKDAA